MSVNRLYVEFLDFVFLAILFKLDIFIVKNMCVTVLRNKRLVNLNHPLCIVKEIHNCCSVINGRCWIIAPVGIKPTLVTPSVFFKIIC